MQTLIIPRVGVKPGEIGVFQLQRFLGFQTAGKEQKKKKEQNFEFHIRKIPKRKGGKASREGNAPIFCFLLK